MAILSLYLLFRCFHLLPGRGPRVVVSTAAFHARVRGSVPGLGGLKETKTFLSHPRVKVSIVGSLCDWEVACSASDRQGSNFESCVWRTVSSQSSHHPQEVLLAQFSLYMHKGGLKPDSFHFICCHILIFDYSAWSGYSYSWRLSMSHCLFITLLCMLFFKAKMLYLLYCTFLYFWLELHFIRKLTLFYTCTLFRPVLILQY